MQMSPPKLSLSIALNASRHKDKGNVKARVKESEPEKSRGVGGQASGRGP